MQEYGVTGRQLSQSYVAPVEMHQQLYALYFVIYDCIFPKYILSYLISAQRMVRECATPS